MLTRGDKGRDSYFMGRLKWLGKVKSDKVCFVFGFQFLFLSLHFESYSCSSLRGRWVLKWFCDGREMWWVYIPVSLISISSSFSRTCNVSRWCRCLGLKAGTQVFPQFSTLTPCWQHPTRKHYMGCLTLWCTMLSFASANTNLSTHMP